MVRKGEVLAPQGLSFCGLVAVKVTWEVRHLLRYWDWNFLVSRYHIQGSGRCWRERRIHTGDKNRVLSSLLSSGDAQRNMTASPLAATIKRLPGATTRS